jgi:hypothetical protein
MGVSNRSVETVHSTLTYHVSSNHHIQPCHLAKGDASPFKPQLATIDPEKVKAMCDPGVSLSSTGV